MQFSIRRKFVLPWLMGTLLLIQPLMIAPFSPAQGSEEKASYHRCGCTVEKASSGACGCAVRRCCTCCTGPEEKTASASCHSSSTDSSTIYVRVCPRGGPEELNSNSSGKIKLILIYFPVGLTVHSALFAQTIQQKPENLFFKPPFPPPEITTSPPTTLI